MRGQAASEYLVTYGWAIFLLTVVIGVIVSSGVFTPTNIISEECYLGTSLSCVFQLYKNEDDLKLVMNVTNGFGYKIGVYNITIKLEDENKNFVINLPQTHFEIESGSSSKIDAILTGSSVSKDSIKKIKVGITYYICVSYINPTCDPLKANLYTISGRIIGRVI